MFSSGANAYGVHFIINKLQVLFEWNCVLCGVFRLRYRWLLLKMPPKAAYEQGYKKDWEDVPQFKNWLQTSRKGVHYRKGITEKNCVKFWREVGKIQRADGTFPFSNLEAFVELLFSLPHSSAACERVFSALTLIKTKARNKLETETVRGLLQTKDFLRGSECFNMEILPEMLAKMNTSICTIKNKCKYNVINVM